MARQNELHFYSSGYGGGGGGYRGKWFVSLQMPEKDLVEHSA